MGYSVIGFGEVEHYGDGGYFILNIFCDIIYDCCEGHCGIRVGAEGVLVWRYEVMCGKVEHELFIYESVKYFSYYGEK